MQTPAPILCFGGSSPQTQHLLDVLEKNHYAVVHFPLFDEHVYEKLKKIIPSAVFMACDFGGGACHNVLGALRSIPHYNRIPILMRARNEAGALLKNLETGVYYCISGSRGMHSFLEIIQKISPVDTLKNDYSLEKTIKEKRVHFILYDLEEAEALSQTIAQFFPDPQRVQLGLCELMINAIEHGNLGISYEEKQSLIKEDVFTQEIARRLLDCPEKNIMVTIVQKEKEVRLSIQDRGQGFDWRPYLSTTVPQASHRYHGRGILLAKEISFDALSYNKKGNKVACTVFSGVRKAKEKNPSESF